MIIFYSLYVWCFEFNKYHMAIYQSLKKYYKIKSDYNPNDFVSYDTHEKGQDSQCA